MFIIIAQMRIALAFFCVLKNTFNQRHNIIFFDTTNSMILPCKDVWASTLLLCIGIQI